VSEAVETNGNGLAQEVQGTFVKSSNGSGERKNMCDNLGNHQNINHLLVIARNTY
jgi:hypothetical protein